MRRSGHRASAATTTSTTGPPVHSSTNVPCVFKCHYQDHLLDRILLINESHEHRVSGFKLALHSDVFRAQLKQLRAQELERHRRTESQDDAGSAGHESSRSPSTSNKRPSGSVTSAGSISKPPANKSRRKRSRSISDVETDKVEVTYEDVASLERVLSCAHWLESTEALDNPTSESLAVQTPEPYSEITLEELEGFLRAAIHFKMPLILDYGKITAMHLLNATICWRLWGMSQRLADCIPDLMDSVTDFILTNFRECSASDDFNELSAADVTFLFQQPHLNVPSELLLVSLITKWVEHAPKIRDKEFVNLLQCVKLRLLTPEELAQLQTNVWFQRNLVECQRLLTDVSPQNGDQQPSQAVTASHSCTLSSQVISYLHTPRLPNEAIFVVGGWEGNQNDPNFGPSQALQVYDCRADRWSRYTDSELCLDAGHAYSSCTFLDGKIYVVGGYTNAAPTQMLKEFNLETRQWRLMAPMHEKRNYVASCLLNGHIFAIGGHNGRVRLSSVEKYDLATNRWSFMPAMVQVRSDAGADTLNGKIYVCGGFDGQRFFCSAEMFDPVANQWTLISAMRDCRSGVALVAHSDFLYAIGGNNGVGRLRSVERYNPESNTWHPVSSMQQQRSNFCTTLLDNEIYVIGGWNDETSSTIASVEKWNPSENDTTEPWKVVRCLPLPASANCCCTVKGYDLISNFLQRD